MSTTRRTFCFIFVMMSLITVLSGCCSATIYKVGDSDGWTAKEDICYDWAKDKEFHVGDSLVFEYDRNNMNDVTQVSSSLEYECCDTSSPKAVYNTGHDVVTLKKPGFYYFISSNQAQCASGQKLDVLVVHDPSRPVPPPPLESRIFPSGKIYMVGESRGWNVSNSDFQSKWSEEKQLNLNDMLRFDYAHIMRSYHAKLVFSCTCTP